MAGKIVHIEIRAADNDRCTSFYRDVFGWQFGESPMPDMDYRMAKLSEEMGAASYPSDESGSGYIVYIDTDDIDASVAKVRQLAGEAADKQPIPMVGWFSSCKDTEGNAFSLFQSDESVSAG
jgi:predicted enzyme related to lactoylglutathione lyase